MPCAGRAERARRASHSSDWRTAAQILLCAGIWFTSAASAHTAAVVSAAGPAPSAIRPGDGGSRPPWPGLRGAVAAVPEGGSPGSRPPAPDLPKTGPEPPESGFASGAARPSPDGTVHPRAWERYQAGLAALRAQRYDEARRALLDAVRIDPHFAGAWLDLALATAAAGDPVQAEEFLDILEQRFVPPPPLAEAIRGLRARLAAIRTAAADPSALPPPRWQWSGAVQAGLGFDRNANAGLSLGSLTLTLPGGLLDLPLADSLRPRSDGYAALNMAAVATRRYGADRADFMLGARVRRNFEVSHFDTLDLRARLGWTIGAASAGEGADGVDGAGGDGAAAVDAGARRAGRLAGPWRLALEQRYLYLDGHTLADYTSVSVERAWPRLPCRPMAGSELELRRYPAVGSLDATIAWLGATAHCPGLAFGDGRAVLGLQARAGHAYARHGAGSGSARPGGDTVHLELGITHEWRWRAEGGAATVLAQLLWERARDARGYSPLLEWNRRREVGRTVAGLTWSRPLPDVSAWLDAPVEVSVSAQWYRQHSNLELFRLSGQLYQVAWKLLW